MKRYGRRGELIKPNIKDSVEELFNSMGEEGWMLRTAINLDSGADTGEEPPVNIVEYIFYREKP